MKGPLDDPRTVQRLLKRAGRAGYCPSGDHYVGRDGEGECPTWDECREAFNLLDRLNRENIDQGRLPMEKPRAVNPFRRAPQRCAEGHGGLRVLDSSDPRRKVYWCRKCEKAYRVTPRELPEGEPSRRTNVGSAYGYRAITVVIYDREEAGAPAFPKVALVDLAPGKAAVITYAPPMECERVAAELERAIRAAGGGA